MTERKAIAGTLMGFDLTAAEAAAFVNAVIAAGPPSQSIRWVDSGIEGQLFRRLTEAGFAEVITERYVDDRKTHPHLASADYCLTDKGKKLYVMLEMAYGE